MQRCMMTVTETTESVTSWSTSVEIDYIVQLAELWTPCDGYGWGPGSFPGWRKPEDREVELKGWTFDY